MLNKVKKGLQKFWYKIKKLVFKDSLLSRDSDLRIVNNTKQNKYPNFKQILQIKRVLSKTEKRVFYTAFFIFWLSIIWAGWLVLDFWRVEIPATGGNYIEAVVGSPDLINPIFSANNDVDMDICYLLYSSLLKYDENHELVTDLAESYEVSEDKKKYTFYLHHNVKWHDGESFNANDVVFTFDNIKNQLVGSPLQVTFQGVEVIALDDYTVQFILPESFSSFLSTLTVGILAEHVWGSTPPEQMRFSGLNQKPIGTGPFKFQKLSKDDSGYIYNFRLEKNEDYYKKPVYLDSFTFEFFPEYEGETGAIEAFREQKVQGISFVPNILRDRVKRRYSTLHVLELPQYTSLFFNSDHNKILDDLDNRKALALAVDKQRIIKEVLKEDAYIINSPILPGFLGYDDELGISQSSIEDANKILDKNWKRIGSEDYRQSKKEELMQDWEEKNKDFFAQIASSTDSTENTSSTTPTFDLVDDSGTKTEAEYREEASKTFDEQLDRELQEAQLFYRKDDNDHVFEVKIVTVNTEEYQKVAKLIAGFWQNIGVKTNLEFIEIKDFNRKVLQSRDYDILLYGEIVGNDADPYPFWHSSQVNYPGLNLSRYQNDKVDKLIEQARESVDSEKQIEYYIDFQKLLLADIPAVFLYMPTYTYVTIDSVKGIDVKRISHPSERFADINTWYIKTKKVWNF